nr:MAG TPA: hypothetical protein [Caudoviricetes sp.]
MLREEAEHMMLLIVIISTWLREVDLLIQNTHAHNIWALKPKVQ